MSGTGPQPKRMLRAEFDRQNAEEQNRAAEQQHERDTLDLRRLSCRLNRFLRYDTNPPASWVTQEFAKAKVGITESTLQAILALDAEDKNKHFEIAQIEETDGQVTLQIRCTRAKSLHAERREERHSHRHSHRHQRHDSNRETPSTRTPPA